MYQVGQAVIYNTAAFKNRLGFILNPSSTKMNDIHGDDIDSITEIKRPATEAEILAEAVKHGWVEKINIESPFDYFELSKKDKWEWISFPPTLQENLKEYCEDGLIAHRLITALNLAK